MIGQTKLAFKLGSTVYNEKKMKEVFDGLNMHFGEGADTDFTKFWANMNEVALTCNVGKIQDSYAAAIMAFVEDLENEHGENTHYFLE